MDRKPTYEELEQKIKDLEGEVDKCKQSEERLRVERGNLKNVFEAMVDGVYIVDQHYDIQYVNSVLKKDFGSYEGRKCYEYFHDIKEVCPWCKNAEVFAGKTVRWEFHVAKNRRTYDLIDTPLQNLDGSILKLEILRDITERKQMEEALRESEKRFRKILEDVSNIAVQGYDEERRVTFWNKASEKLYGYSEEEALGNKLEDLIIPQNMRVQVQEFIQRWIEFGEKIPAGEFILVGKNGKDVPVFSSHAMIETANGKEMFCIDVNLASIKRAEERIAASLKEKEVLLREIHHRVKNNMQVIVSLLRMHARQVDDGDTRLGQVFDDCRDRVNAMSLIHEALYQSEDLARIDFEDYLKKLCRNLSRAYNASNQGIVVTVERCNVALGMDQGFAVGMVISELVTNAFKHAFTSGNGGIVSVSLSGIAGEEVELIVADNGKGFSPEIDIQALSSLGLRLAVAAITRELGGSIKVERNGGTRFIIHFKCTS